MCVFPRAVSLLFCCGFSRFSSLRYYLCEVAERSSLSRALPPQPFILISPISTFCSVSQLDIQLTQTRLTASPSLVPGFTSLPSISAQGATTYLGRPGLLASFLSHTSLASDCAHSVFTRALLSFHCLLSSPCTATTVVQASSFP